MCDNSQKEGGSWSHETAQALTCHFQHSFYHSGSGSDQDKKNFHHNQDRHGIPGVLHDSEDAPILAVPKSAAEVHNYTGKKRGAYKKGKHWPNNITHYLDN